MRNGKRKNRRGRVHFADADIERMPEPTRTRVRAAIAAATTVVESSVVDVSEGANRVEAMAAPVHIKIHNRRKRLLDIDNYHYKPIIDGIREAGLLPDDRPEIVLSTSVTHEKCDTEETIVVIEVCRGQEIRVASKGSA